MCTALYPWLGLSRRSAAGFKLKHIPHRRHDLVILRSKFAAVLVEAAQVIHGETLAQALPELVNCGSRKRLRMAEHIVELYRSAAFLQ